MLEVNMLSMTHFSIDGHRLAPKLFTAAGASAFHSTYSVLQNAETARNNFFSAKNFSWRIAVCSSRRKFCPNFRNIFQNFMKICKNDRCVSTVAGSVLLLSHQKDRRDNDWNLFYTRRSCVYCDLCICFD